MAGTFKATLQGEFSSKSWPELQVWTEGDDQSVRRVTHPLGQLVLTGHSGASDCVLEGTLNEALQRDDLQPLTQLPGSYSAVLATEGRLTVFTDPVGQNPVYYSTSGRQTIFGSRPSLAAPNEQLTPNLSDLTMGLVLPGAYARVFPESSSFKGIRKLPGGSMAHATVEGVRTTTYETLMPRHNSLTEAAEGLRSALTGAISSRLEQGPVSSDLSGVDSGTLAFLLEQMSEGQVETFFSRRADVSSGDRRYVERWQQLNGALHLHEFISNSELTTFTYDDFLSMPRTEDLAYAINANPNGWKFLRSYFNFVHDRNGGAIHLTGDGGDEVFAVRQSYTADLLPRAPGRFMRHNWAYARLQNISPLKLMLDMTRLSRAAPSSDLLRAADNLRHSEQESDSWLTHGVRDQLIDFLQTHISGLPKNVRVGDHDALSALRSAGQYTTMLRYYAEHANVHVHSPCLDNDVVKAAFSVPAYLRGDPEDYKKILSLAFKGIVPDEVLQRSSKGAYDEEVCQAMVQSSAVYKRILGESRLADMGIIEPRKVSETLDRAETQPMKTMWMLDRIMSIEGWVRSLESRQWLAAPSTKPITVSRNSDVNTHKMASTLTPAQFMVPRHIHALSSDSGAIVLFNQRTNMYHPLDVPRSNILRAIASAGNTEAVAERMIAAYPQATPAVIRSDITRCLEEFQQLGVVCPTLDIHTRELPQTAGEIRLDANEDKTALRARANIKVPFRVRLMVAAAFVLDKAVSRATPGARLPLLQAVQRRWAEREATTEEAERLLHTAHTTLYFGRIACNEAPYTAALAAAMLRRKVSWHLGASFSPLTFHAWIEVDGKPIRTEREGKVAGRFQSFFDEGVGLKE